MELREFIRYPYVTFKREYKDGYIRYAHVIYDLFSQKYGLYVYDMYSSIFCDMQLPAENTFGKISDHMNDRSDGDQDYIRELHWNNILHNKSPHVCTREYEINETNVKKKMLSLQKLQQFPIQYLSECTMVKLLLHFSDIANFFDQE